MLCYRCGSHVPDTSDSCASCGQKLTAGAVRQATGTFSRKRPGASTIEGAPYKTDDKLAGRYLIKDVVGVGPLGFVFRAHDEEVDVEVALKVINPRLVQTSDERKQFGKALRASRKLVHPNLARIYEEGEDNDRPFFSMQFLEGLTLRKIIDLRVGKGQVFTLQEVEPILGQIATALDAVHKVCPHSDLKPENVIVLPDLLKLTDMGVGSAIPRLPFVQAMKSRGADRYMAPEFIEGGSFDHRADIYSMGVILGEMLSGLWPDGSIPEIAAKNPEIPPPVEGLYRKALNQNPGARFKSALELFEEFSEATRKVSPPPMKARPEPASGVAPPRSRPIAAGGGGALQLNPRKSEKGLPPPPPMLPADEEVTVLGANAAQVLAGASAGVPPPFRPSDMAPDVRESTEIYDSQVLHRANEAEARALARGSKGKRWLRVLAVALVGIIAGAGLGYWQWKAKDAKDATRRPAPAVTVSHPVDATPPVTPPPGGEPPSLGSLPPTTEPAPAAMPTVATPVPSEPEPVDAGAVLGEKVAATSPADRPVGKSSKLTDPDVPVAKARKEVKVPPVKGGEGGCPEGMRLVPASSFRMGTAKDDPMMGFDERVIAPVEVAAYCIDVFEYPNRRGLSPTVNVSWGEAKRLCEARSKRLCSEEEWEKACKGPNNARFPYGSTFDANACDTEDETGEDRTLAVSGQFAKCRSGYGVADLSGNVAEWTSSAYSSNADKAQKGGSFDRPDYAARCSARKNGAPGSKSPVVGFRCCVSPGSSG